MSGSGLLNPQREVVGVQYLRAFAASSVLLHHALDQYPQTHALMPNGAFQGGVDIFFVISGFIMMHTTAHRRMTGTEFLKRRLLRIAPLYWIMTLFVAMLAVLAPAALRDTVFTVPHFVASLLFFPYPNPARLLNYDPLIKLGWTLNYEMFFYLVFALLIFLAPARRFLALLLSFLLLIATTRLLAIGSGPFLFWSDPIVLEFVSGCALGVLAYNGVTHQLPPWLAGTLLALSVIGFLTLPQPDTTSWMRLVHRGLPATGIVLAVISLESCLPRPTRGFWKFAHLLGDASYSLYLAHLYAVRALTHVWDKWGPAVTTPLIALAFTLVCICLGLATGLATYWLIEKPATRFARARLRRKPS